MEVETYVCLLKGFSNVLWGQHEVISMDPNHLEVLDLRADFYNFLSDFLVDGDICTPVIMDELRILLDI